eukprot:gene17445-19190_t
MFSSGFKGQRLRVNLKLAINRLKMLEKKKTEIAMKARKEIADFIQLNKSDRARIRVEHIIREDYMVEAMELIEMYCDLLLARFGLIESMKTCDSGLTEAVSTLIWAAPRLYSDVQELKVVEEQLILKYGKDFGQQARTNSSQAVNERLILKMSPDAPPSILVERYLMEIARNYNVAYQPDSSVMISEGIPTIDSKEFDNIGNFSGPPGGPSAPGGGGHGGGGGGGGIGFENLGNRSMAGGGPPLPSIPSVPGMQPGAATFPGHTPYPTEPPPYQPSNHNEKPPLGPDPSMAYPPPSASMPSNLPMHRPPPAGNLGPPPGIASIPDLPTVPSGSPPPGSVGGHSAKGDDVDFDDLARRFEELKKKK